MLTLFRPMPHLVHLKQVSQGCCLGWIALHNVTVVVHQLDKGSHLRHFGGRFPLKDDLYRGVLHHQLPIRNFVPKELYLSFSRWALLHLKVGDRGLSKLISKAPFVRESQALKPLWFLPDPPIGEELIVSGMQERISKMLNHANVFIFLSRDLTTLEALITFASWAYLNIHKKPISLLNVNNFYNGLITFLNHAIKNYFIPPSAKNLFICTPTTNELLDLLQAYKPKTNLMTLALDWGTDDDGSDSRKKCKLDLTLRL